MNHATWQAPARMPSRTDLAPAVSPPTEARGVGVTNHGAKHPP